MLAPERQKEHNCWSFAFRSSRKSHCSILVFPLEIWLQLDEVLVLSTKFRKQTVRKESFSTILMPYNRRLLQRGATCIQRSFFIIYFPLIEYLFFLRRNCHFVKSILTETMEDSGLPTSSISCLSSREKKPTQKPQRPLFRKNIPLT